MTPGSLDAALLAEMDNDESPSQRKLAEQLQISCERLPGLYDVLRDLLAKCRTANFRKSRRFPLKGEIST